MQGTGRKALDVFSAALTSAVPVGKGAQLNLRILKLWWPNGCGDACLQDSDQAATVGRWSSDEHTTRFGDWLFGYEYTTSLPFVATPDGGRLNSAKPGVDIAVHPPMTASIEDLSNQAVNVTDGNAGTRLSSDAAAARSKGGPLLSQSTRSVPRGRVPWIDPVRDGCPGRAGPAPCPPCGAACHSLPADVDSTGDVACLYRVSVHSSANGLVVHRPRARSRGEPGTEHPR